MRILFELESRVLTGRERGISDLSWKGSKRKEQRERFCNVSAHYLRRPRPWRFFLIDLWNWNWGTYVSIMGEVFVWFAYHRHHWDCIYSLVSLGRLRARSIIYVMSGSARGCCVKPAGWWSGSERPPCRVARSPASVSPLASQPEMCNHRCRISFNLLSDAYIFM